MSSTSALNPNELLIHAIADRVKREHNREGVQWGEVDWMTTVMDLSACHEKCPLRLLELLLAPSASLMHDVMGINRHLNHDTYELENCFLPRYAMPPGPKAQMWACACGYTTEWYTNDIPNRGEPICPNCDIDMLPVL